jgi:hypothetical protein
MMIVIQHVNIMMDGFQGMGMTGMYGVQHHTCYDCNDHFCIVHTYEMTPSICYHCELSAACAVFQSTRVNCATLPLARNVNPYICARDVIDLSVVSAARRLIARTVVI